MKTFVGIVSIALIAAAALMFALPREEACPARSVDELKAKFEHAFTSKDEEAFLSLFHWAGMESGWRGQMQRELSAMLSKELIRAEVRDAGLSNADLREIEAHELHLNIAPVSTLYFEHSIGPKVTDPREKTAGRLAIGKVGACYAFGVYGVRPRASNPPRHP